MASFMRKLAPQLVTHSPPPTPKDVYVQTAGGQGTRPKRCAYSAGGQWRTPPKGCA